MGGSSDVEHGGGQGEEIKEPLMGNRPNACATNSSSSGEGESISWVVFLSTFVAICGSFEFGSCTGYSAPAQSGIRNDLGLSLAEYSVLGSILPIGAMVGAITSGQIADFIGRKGAMGVSSVVCIAGWLAIYFAQGVLSLDVGRFCTGYGTGVFSYVVPVFIAEITPKNLRGGLTTVNQLMICTGVSVTYILGNLMSWRMLALTGLVPCVILLLGLFFIPESPRWLAKVNRQKEFEVALRRLRGKNADISIEASEIQDFIEMLERIPKPKVLDLFQKRYARSVIVGVALMVFQQFDGINGIVFYASETFVTAGFKSGELGTILMALVPPPVTLLGAVLMDKTGRRPLLMMSASGTCLGCILAGAGLFFKGHQIFLNLVPATVLTGVLLFVGSFALGIGPIPWVMMSEIFPINIKGMAGSLVTLVNWFGSWAVSLTFNFLMSWSTPGTFFLYAAVCGITVLFVVKVVPETKGRTLEEIQSDMNS